MPSLSFLENKFESLGAKPAILWGKEKQRIARDIRILRRRA